MMQDHAPAKTRLLHAMLRVTDLDRSLAFYCEQLGMAVQRRLDFRDDRFSLIYLGYGNDREETVVELTWNWDQAAPYEHGNAYGHLGIGVADLHQFCQAIADKGVNVTREPGEMGRTGIHIAFIVDPDGYRIELIQLPYPLESMGEHVTYGREGVVAG